MQQDGLEAALAAVQLQVESAARSSAVVARELKKARGSAADGRVRELRKALDAAVAAAEEAAERAREAQHAFGFDDTAHLSSGAYAAELLATAAELDVAMVQEDDRLLCYPSLLRVLPGDAALDVDRRRERRLRPTVVVAALAAAQSRPPRFRAEPFLESLSAAYSLLAAQQDRPAPVLRLDEVWGVLTLLPGAARDYSRPEFARDLYLLARAVSARPGRVGPCAGTPAAAPGVPGC